MSFTDFLPTQSNTSKPEGQSSYQFPLIMPHYQDQVSPLIDPRGQLLEKASDFRGRTASYIVSREYIHENDTIATTLLI